MHLSLSSLAFHLDRLQWQLGRKLRLGSNSYRVRGYWPDRLSTDIRHEPNVYRSIERVLTKESGAFIDIGVNVGQTLLKVLSIDPMRPYFGFEPQIACVFFVDQFIRDNGLNHAQVIPLALAETEGFLQLYSRRICDDMASLQGSIRCDGGTRGIRTTVPTRKGDDAITDLDLDAISMIKIDVEGAELQVLRGLRQSLVKFRPAVLFEQLPNFHGHDRVMSGPEDCDRNKRAATGIQEFFAHAGYNVNQIDKGGEEHRVEELDLDSPESFVSSDYIAYPVSS